MIRPRYQATMLHQIETSIAHWEPPPSVGLSARDIIRQLSPQLQHKRDQGWRLADLVAELKKVGVTLSASTLRSYLREFRAAQAGEERSADPREPDSAAPASERAAPAPCAPLIPSSLVSPQAAHIARLNEDV